MFVWIIHESNLLDHVKIVDKTIGGKVGIISFFILTKVNHNDHLTRFV